MSDFIKRLSDSASLTDILIQMEDFLDNLDIFAFQNWFEGEIADGPVIERHWVSMTLKYDYKEMPDPAGGLRLLKYGVQVAFRKEKEEDVSNRKERDIAQVNAQLSHNQNPTEVDRNKKTPQLKTVWLVDIKIPRHFIDDLSQMDDLNDMNVDSEHLKAASDSDLQAKDAYNSDNTDPTQDETTGEVDQQSSKSEGL